MDILAELNAVQREAVEAVNGPEMDVIVRWLGGDRKQRPALLAAARRKRSHMLVNQIHGMKKPHLPGLDSKSKVSRFEGGHFSGEVWVVELHSGRVLCRERASARSSEHMESQARDAYRWLQADFVARVAQGLAEAQRRVAPDLVRPAGASR